MVVSAIISVFQIVFFSIYQSSLTFSLVHCISSLSPSSELELDFGFLSSDELKDPFHFWPFFSSYHCFWSVHLAGGFYCLGSEISFTDFLDTCSCLDDTGFKSQESDLTGESYGSHPLTSHFVSLVVAFHFPNFPFSSSFDWSWES